MPSRLPVALLASVAALGLATACEKKSPIVTMTAHGVVVKAHAVEYCRGDDCRTTDDGATLKIHPGDTLGIDVPRSLAEEGWSATLSNRSGQSQEFFGLGYDHYRSQQIGSLNPGEPLFITILRDEKHGRGVWRFTIVAG